MLIRPGPTNSNGIITITATRPSLGFMQVMNGQLAGGSVFDIEVSRTQFSNGANTKNKVKVHYGYSVKTLSMSEAFNLPASQKTRELRGFCLFRICRAAAYFFTGK